MHKECLNEYIKTQLNCPICRKSLVKIDAMEAYYDQVFSGTIMPEEYRNAKVYVFCNDCGQESAVPFHVLGGKC